MLRLTLISAERDREEIVRRPSGLGGAILAALPSTGSVASHVLPAETLRDLKLGSLGRIDPDLVVVRVEPSLLDAGAENLDALHRFLRANAYRAVAVLVEPCDLWATPLAAHDLVIPGGRAVSEWSDEKMGWAAVVKDLMVRFPERLQAVRQFARTSRILGLRMLGLTVFQNVDLDFCAGVNIFLGTNGSGKTHALKVLYGSLSAATTLAREQGPQGPRSSLTGKVAEKLAAVFRPADGALHRIIRMGTPGAFTRVTCDAGLLETLVLDGRTDVDADRVPVPRQVLFIPSREALSLFEGFIAAYQNRELSIDETYYDLCVALGASRLRGKAAEEAASLLADLGDVLGGDIELKGGRFALRPVGSSREVEAHLLAEGQRKLASLVQLIRNGSLTRDTILFWDEPEASLNPKLTEKVVQVLLRLAAQGVQIFLATHDYLIAHKLSLAAEHGTNPGAELRFFSFSRQDEADPTSPVTVQQGATLADLEHDPILEEYLAFAAREEALLAAGAGRS